MALKCKISGHSLHTAFAPGGGPGSLKTVIECSRCGGRWNLNGGEWGASRKLAGFDSGKIGKSLSPKDLAPVYVGLALKEEQITQPQAVELYALAKKSPGEVTKMFGQ